MATLPGSCSTVTGPFLGAGDVKPGQQLLLGAVVDHPASTPAGVVAAELDAAGPVPISTLADPALAPAPTLGHRSSMERGLVHLDARVTTGEWMHRWPADHCSELSPGSVQTYRYAVESYIRPELGNVRLAQLTPAHVDRAA